MNFPPNSTSETIDFKDVCLFYLSDNSVPALNCTNIIRLIEIAAILKPNQASTERTTTIIINSVKYI